VHSPVFWTPKSEEEPDPDKYFKDLEFGEEVQFFRQHRALELGTRSVDGTSCEALFLKSGAREVTLLVSSKTDKPYQIDIGADGKVEFSIRYVSYETGSPFQQSLFQPPKGIKITEAKDANSPALATRYDDLAAWAAHDNDNSKQFVRDLQKARRARDVALALRDSARRQQRTTDELVRLIGLHPELGSVPELGLDNDGLRMWKQAHPDTQARQSTRPPEVVAIQQQMQRFNTNLYANGAQPADVLRKYRDDPEVGRALKELEQVLDENRRKLLEVLR
jgi:hypothetical protein